MSRMRFFISIIWFLGLATFGAGQTPAPGEMVLINGKIITVDDKSFTSRLGTIAQAMHVKDGKVLHIGTNDQIRPMAGAGVKVIDLKGRTVIPGLILTHEHPWDWNPVEPPMLRSVLNDSNVILRVLEDSPKKNLEAFPGVLKEAVAKAKPGQWIYILFTDGNSYQYANASNAGLGRGNLDEESFDVIGFSGGKYITKAMLDAAAPNNPVVVRQGLLGAQPNQKAVDEARKVFPQPDVGMALSDETGQGGYSPARWWFQDVIMKNYYPQLVEMMRLGMEWWGGYGMTTFSSNAYDPANIRVYTDLDRKGRMPIREMWTWNWRSKYFNSDPYFLEVMRNFDGLGSDYLWFGGGRIIEGGPCTLAEPAPSAATSKINPEGLKRIEAARNTCAYAPGAENSKLLYDYIKAGNRFVNHHLVGDRDIDNILNIIQQASRDAGMTDEDIRAKRHALDHAVLFPRTDQVDLYKRLGIVVSGNLYEIHSSSPTVFAVYGEKGTDMVVPYKRMNDAGISGTIEMDRPIGGTNVTIFDGISWMITRKAWDGKTYAQNQGVDRETALKLSTYRGAYYVMRENTLGSLEPGKWADFLVLDKDYLTIPVDDIAKLRVLMTVVGGKVIHLVPSIARELGTQPSGAQVKLGGAPAQW